MPDLVPKALIAVLAVVPGAAPGVRAQEPGGRPVLAPVYSTLSVANELTGSPLASERETVLAVGRLYPRGAGGPWMLRGELAIGLVTGFRFLDGAFGGPRLGVTGVLQEPAFGVGAGRRLQLAASLEGAAYLAYDLPEAENAWRFVPAVAWGVGVRLGPGPWGGPWIPAPVRRSLTTLELVREERLGGWRSRTYLRIALGRPAGRRRPPGR